MYTFLLFVFIVSTIVFFVSSLGSHRERERVLKQYLDTSYVLEHLGDGIIEYDVNLVITRLNSSAEQILGLNRSEIIGKKITEAAEAETSMGLAQLVKEDKAQSVGERTVGEVTIKTPTEKRLRIFTIPKIVAPGSAPLGFIKIIHDITREEIITRNKTNLVAIVSHQMRTPLSGVRWILKALLEGDFGQLPKEQTDLINRGLGASENMIGLIDDMLDVASIEESDFRYNISRQDLVSLIRSVAREHTEEAEPRNIKIVENYPAEKIEINFDYKRLKIALSNLIANAINYSREGGTVTVGVALDEQNITISVEDGGIGIPDDSKLYIFTKFFRAENAKKVKTRGTGLGLFLVKKIAEGHGGDAWFQSTENVGSTFYLKLPASPELKRGEPHDSNVDKKHPGGII